MALIVTALGLLYVVLFMWEEDDKAMRVVDLPDGHPSILGGGSCPMGYDEKDDDEDQVTCEQLYNREWYESALSCVQQRREKRDNNNMEGIRIDEELERLVLEAI